MNGNSIFLMHNNKELINLDLKNGKIRWSTEIAQDFSDEKSNLWLTPVLMNNKLILVGGNKKLVIVNPFSGEIEAELRLPDIPITSPIVVNKRFFLCSKTHLFFPLSETSPKIVLVGKPNVGKSTLFNTIIGRKESIVGAEHGLTRDFQEIKFNLEKNEFKLLDTAGIGLKI